MHSYVIDVTKELGGDVSQFPSLTMSNREDAFERFEGLIKAEFDELNAEFMREIGGTTDLYLGICDNTLGFDADIIRHVTVKRPKKLAVSNCVSKA